MQTPGMVSLKTIKLNAEEVEAHVFLLMSLTNTSSFSLSTFLFMPQGEWEGGSVKIAACRGSAAHLGGMQKEGGVSGLLFMILKVKV
jgi:hypothetical protein